MDQIYVDDKVHDYIVDLVFATRNPEQYKLDLKHFIQFGASPRATISLTLAAKAWALLQGRDLRDAGGREEHRPGRAAPSHHSHLRSRGAGRDDGCDHQEDFQCRASAVKNPNSESVSTIIRWTSAFTAPHDLAELLETVRRVEVRTNRLVNDMMVGAYLSHFKGRGMDFEELREYIPGDDVRDIDWNVTLPHGPPVRETLSRGARTGDGAGGGCLGSSAFGSAQRTKREFAAEVAATLAFSATRNSDKVALLLFTDQVELFLPPRKGPPAHSAGHPRNALLRAQARGTNIPAALTFLNHVLHRRSIVFLLTDFLHSLRGTGVPCPPRLSMRRAHG